MIGNSNRSEEELQAVSHKGQNFRGLAAHFDQQMGTLRYRSSKGTLPQGADILMPMLHGMGPMTSHSGSMLATLNALTASKKKGGRSESLKALRALPNYRLVGGEAIDLPGSHGKAVPKSLDTLDGLCEWISEWLISMREHYEVPLVPIARSASAMIVQRVHEQRPGLLDGLVLLSPMAPFDAAHSNADLLHRVEVSQCELNQVAFDYMNRLTEETDWDSLPDPFPGLPTLIMTGQRDTQVSDRVRDRCHEWADRLPHVDFTNQADAGHDVFNLRDRVPGRAAYARLYEFLAAVAPLQSEPEELTVLSEDTE